MPVDRQLRGPIFFLSDKFLSEFKETDAWKVLNIGGEGGRFRILGGGGGGARGPAFSCLETARLELPPHPPAPPPDHLCQKNQCQIIKFLILKTDNIAKSRTELKGILLPIPSF